jgi:hypothetical protein
MEVNEEIEEGISFGALEKTDLFGNPVPTDEVEENEEPAEDVLLEAKNEEDEETTEPKEKEAKATKASKSVKKESKEDLAFSFDDDEEGEEGSTTEDGGKDYSQLAKTLVESGTWQEFEIEGEDKTLDKATFEELKKQQLSKQASSSLADLQMHKIAPASTQTGSAGPLRRKWIFETPESSTTTPIVA